MTVKRLYVFVGGLLRKSFLKGNCVAGTLLGMVVVLKSAVMFNMFKGNHTVNVWEPFIVSCASPINSLVILIGAVLVMSDAPFLDGLSFMSMHRVKRKVWYIGNWLYMILREIKYYIILVVTSVILYVNSGYVENRWSQTILRCMRGYTESMDRYAIPQINGSLENLKPSQALLIICGLMLLYSLFLVSVLFVFNLVMTSKLCGTVSIAVIHIVATLMDSQGNMLPFSIVKYNLFRNAFFTTGYNPKISTISFSFCFLFLLVYMTYIIGEGLVKRLDIH